MTARRDPRRYECNGNELSADGAFVLIPNLTHPERAPWRVPVGTFDRAVDGWDTERDGGLPCARDTDPSLLPFPTRRTA